MLLFNEMICQVHLKLVEATTLSIDVLFVIYSQ